MEQPKQTRLLAGLFAGVILLELLGECAVELAEWPALVFATKPLMMPVLAAYLWSSVNGKPGGFHRFVLAGLFFSWLGDIFLMVTWTGGNFFIYGLVAFLVAHLMYITAFRRVVRPEIPPLLRIRPIAALPLLLYIGGLIFTFYRYGNAEFFDLQAPVLIYSAVILAMVLMALNRKGRVPESSYSLVFLGALLFMFSDSVIALNKFTPALEGMSLAARLFIMSTYAVGQFLIVSGSVRQPG